MTQAKEFKTLSLADLKKGTKNIHKRVQSNVQNSLVETMDQAQADIEANGTGDYEIVFNAMEDKTQANRQYRSEYQGLVESVPGVSTAEAKAEVDVHMQEAWDSAPALVEAFEEYQKATDGLDWDMVKACKRLVDAQRKLDGQGTSTADAINSVRVKLNVPFRVTVDAIVRRDRPGMKKNGKPYARS